MRKDRLMPSSVAVNGHFPTNASAGWLVNDVASLVFVGGQISADQTGTVVGAGNLQEQARNVFLNIERVLRDGGATWADVVRMDAFYVLEDGTDVETFWETVSQVSAEFVSDPGPVWTAIQVPSLAYLGLLLEIDAVAALDH